MLVFVNFIKLFCAIMMNSDVYRWCAVPKCINTSIKTPNKIFVTVPKVKKVRNTWLNLARRDPGAISSNSVIYFCEDHFDLPNDMENYMQYHLMGSVSKVHMKPGCIPTKFECQLDRRKRTANTIERSYVLKKQRKIYIEDSEKDLNQKSTPATPLAPPNISSDSSVLHTIAEHQEGSTSYPKSIDKSIQVHIITKFRSKAIQVKPKMVNQLTSPSKPDRCSVSTSPFKITTCIPKPNISIFKHSIEDQSDSDVSYSPLAAQQTSPSIQSLQMKSSSECSELMEEAKKEEQSIILKYTLLKIMKNPRSYIGLPKDCCYLLDLIKDETKIPINHILLCLRKIRFNNPFRELADDFTMSATYASKIFFKNVPLIASVMRPFIVKLDKNLTKQTLPMAFRHKFHYISCIIDCLEIEVQKPTKSVNQALSWSDYKKCNTIKYLVSCTPNGLVNYVSPGYGGRITDTCLVESCDFVKCLQPGMCVMADRGFKHVQNYLYKESCTLVRPPTVVTGAKLSKTEVKETKQIASLRIHVERVIRRLREFHMLKSHACLNTNFVKILDDIIVIACALINLQDSLIK